MRYRWASLRTTVILLPILLALVPAASAGSIKRTYQDCGAGKFTTNRGAAETANLVFSMATFVGFTSVSASGTSDTTCRPGYAQADPVRTFVAVNYDSLSRDMARGSGEYLNALATLLGCPTRVYGRFGEVSRARFAELTGSPAKAEVLLYYLRGELARHPTLAAACRPVS